MKKLLMAILSGAMVLSLSSCMSTKRPVAVVAPQEVATQPTTTQINKVEYPDWFLTLPSDETYIYCAGYAEAGNLQTAIKKAEVEAKTQLAEQVSTKVKEVIKNYVNDAGEGDNRQNMDAFESFALHTTQANLVGVERVKLFVLSNGGVCVLSKMPKANLKTALDEIQVEAQKQFVQNDAASAANAKMAESFDNLLANGLI